MIEWALIGALLALAAIGVGCFIGGLLLLMDEDWLRWGPYGWGTETQRREREKRLK